MSQKSKAKDTFVSCFSSSVQYKAEQIAIDYFLQDNPACDECSTDFLRLIGRYIEENSLNSFNINFIAECLHSAANSIHSQVRFCEVVHKKWPSECEDCNLTLTYNVFEIELDKILKVPHDKRIIQEAAYYTILLCKLCKPEKIEDHKITKSSMRKAFVLLFNARNYFAHNKATEFAFFYTKNSEDIECQECFGQFLFFAGEQFNPKTLAHTVDTFSAARALKTVFKQLYKFQKVYSRLYSSNYMYGDEPCSHVKRTITIPIFKKNLYRYVRPTFNQAKRLWKFKCQKFGNSNECSVKLCECATLCF